MRETSPPSPAVIVGIDGSQGAVDAALWAIDEAIDRDLPLRLVYAVEPSESEGVDRRSLTHDFVTAEAAMRYASMAIESTDKPVKIEVEIVQGRALTTLVAASRSAAVVCVGATGTNGASGQRAGSMVADLVAKAHCPLAIVSQSGRTNSETPWILVVFDGTPEGASVLSHAVAEARVRSAPLRVLTCWRPNFPDIQDTRASADSRRFAKATLERSLAPWRELYPELDVQAVAELGNPMNYLARHVDSIGLIVLGRRPGEQLSELAGVATHAALFDLSCSVLICERHSAP
ncbi:MAG: universal stress protein [Mycobacterium sp.]